MHREGVPSVECCFNAKKHLGPRRFHRKGAFFIHGKGASQGEDGWGVRGGGPVGVGFLLKIPDWGSPREEWGGRRAGRVSTGNLGARGPFTAQWSDRGKSLPRGKNNPTIASRQK